MVRATVVSGAILLVGILAALGRADTVVQFNVSPAYGPIDNFQVQLFDSQAPLTVANFLSYVNDHSYDNTIIHRDSTGFVMQGGGFAEEFTGGNLTGIIPVFTKPPVQNEFDPSRSNVRGTIAMAKQPSDPNSATSQWFINLGDNSANLDNQNGGFTVFGQVISGMDYVDAVDSLGPTNLNGLLDPSGAYGQPFSEVPVVWQDQSHSAFQFISVTSVAVVPEPSSLALLGAGGLALLVCARRLRVG